MEKKIMIQGTGSSVGKSAIVTGLGRILYQDGYKVTPFKSQNMALNSFVDHLGREMGRAQVVQAEGCKTQPIALMNPILMKPNSDTQSQILINGVPYKNMDGKTYFENTHLFKSTILESYKLLVKDFDICILEGGGSPAEINFRDSDIVNMGMAELVDAPVILVGDIERGGVFASIYGTVALLDEKDKKRIKGYIINKFQGDPSLLDPAFKILDERFKKENLSIPCLGVVPKIELNLEEEDSLDIKLTSSYEKVQKDILNIVIIHLKHLSNKSDFDPLFKIPGVKVQFSTKRQELEKAHLIIIPGTKNTIFDLKELKKINLDHLIRDLSKTIPILGICGGFQVLGSKIIDKNNIESLLGSIDGLDLVQGETFLLEDKEIISKKYPLSKTLPPLLKGLEEDIVEGYEIHHGITFSTNSPLFKSRECIGIFNENIIGTYLHGIFENQNFTTIFLNNLCRFHNLPLLGEISSYHQEKEKEFNLWADHLRKNLDIEKILEIIG